MTETLSQLIPTLSGIVGVLIGASIGPLINHQLTTRYSKKDLIFKRKLDYFEKILDTIEKNSKLYKQQIRKLESSEDNKMIKKVVEEMKKERKNFLMMSSPLYFDVTKISRRIINFVKIEKDIFNRLSSLEKINEKEKEVLVGQLKRMLMILEKRGSDILFEMKKELKKS
ncbi:MAG: YqiA/YcfP family alpha/beta fold hydrolase [Nanoarchaeota archaeon]